MTIRAETPFMRLDLQKQALKYHSRKRVRSLHDPTKELTRTHQFFDADVVTRATISTGDVFPIRNADITFSSRIEITGLSASGLIFEIGSSTTGVKLAVDSGTFLLAAGDSAGGDGGIDGSGAFTPLGTIGSRIQIVAAISPGLGQARLWANGILIARIQNTPPVQLTNENWSDTGDGSAGLAQNGTSNTRVAITAAPSDFILTERVSAYFGQLPRQFNKAV